MIAFLIYAIIGFCTGVLGICATASAAWQSKFDSSIILVPIIGALAFVVCLSVSLSKPRKTSPAFHKEV